MTHAQNSGTPLANKGNTKMLDEYRELIDIIQSAPALAIIALYFYMRAFKKNNQYSHKKLKICIDKLDRHVISEVDKMESIVDRGIEAGNNSRKEIRIDINKVSNDISSIEGYLSNQNGYKKNKITGA